MIRDFVPLPTLSLDAGVTFHCPSHDLPKRVTLESPAFEVMTDLKRVAAATIDPGISIEAANTVMVKRGVRLLFVVDIDNSVIGLMTRTDVVGEKPMQIIQERGVKRQEILVRDIMTPQSRLEVLNSDEVQSAKVGHVVATLKKSGRQHAIVVDVNETDPKELLVNPSLPRYTQTIRGIFSANQVARQLGVQIQTTEVARTFAEIEAHFFR